MASHALQQEKYLKITQRGEPGFRVVIVGRDSLTGSLLADSLIHNLNCDAVTARHSDVLRLLGSTVVDLVIISADLNSNSGAGFELASAVSSGYPSVPIIVLGAEEGTRTPTPLRVRGPEPRASANSATSARYTSSAAFR
jgi:hypothetical protein